MIRAAEQDGIVVSVLGPTHKIESDKYIKEKRAIIEKIEKTSSIPKYSDTLNKSFEKIRFYVSVNRLINTPAVFYFVLMLM